MYLSLSLHIYIHIYIFIYIYIYPPWHEGVKPLSGCSAVNPQTKSLDFRGFD